MNTLTFELVLIRCEQRLGVADATTTIVGEPWGTFDRFRSFLSAPNGWNFKEGRSSVALVGCMDPGHTLTMHENLKDYCMKTNLCNPPGKFLYKMLRDGVSVNYE